jgi:hypothetical protein
MTKVVVEGFGWVYLVMILDRYTKEMVGDYAGMRCGARHGLAASDRVVNRQFRSGPAARAYR